MSEKKIYVTQCNCGSNAALVIFSLGRNTAVYQCHRGDWFCRPIEELQRASTSRRSRVDPGLASQTTSPPPSG